MKYFKELIVFLLLFSSFVNASCKKSSASPVNTAPTNLVVNATASTDNSGKVSFIATADNAVIYLYDFGNGGTATSTTGTTEYIYTTEGTNTYTVKVTAKSSSNQSISKSITVTIAYGAKLVWSDEFDVDGAPNPAKWGYDLGNNNGWGNNELEYYTNRAENSVVSNGVLKITAKKESFSGYNYTSARLLSKDKYSFKYGRVEFRAKIPAGVGTWPALWMLGDDIGTAGWPACGEIDVMEHVGKSLNTIYGTLHYPGRSGGNADGSTKVIENSTTEFKIYSLDWSASSIKIYADGQLIHSITNSAAVPFNHNFFLIMNVAMGGNFGGPMDPNINSVTMEVDYVRVYQ